MVDYNYEPEISFFTFNFSEENITNTDLSDSTINSDINSNLNINQRNFFSSRELNSYEQQILNDLVVSYKKDWCKIVRRFKTLTGKDIPKEVLCTKYLAMQNFKMKGSKFTPQEDGALIDLVGKYGHNWVKIAESFPGRDPLSLRNRHYKMKYATGKSNEKSSTTLSNEKEMKMLIDDIYLEKIPDFLRLIHSMLMSNPLPIKVAKEL